MSLPSQEVLDDIKDLITEITGFQEEDENFTICQRYCLSHVVHHSYPFINRTTVKNLINSYVSRFYGHGYFKVSQELNHQVKRFLSNEKLFEKNPQYDIQWSLLSLLSSLSSNLTSVKQLPELLPIDDEEKEAEETDWKEYLTRDLQQGSLEALSSESELFSTEEDGSEEDQEQRGSSNTEAECEKEKKDVNIIFDNKLSFNSETSSLWRRKKIEEFLNNRKSKIQLENDFRVRGNLSEKFDILMTKEGISRKTQLLSEFETMEYILYQFQTGQRIFLRKGLVHPALTSVTEDTLCNFLESLQPYFVMVRTFRDFDADVTEAMHPENQQEENFQLATETQSAASFRQNKRKISNVLYTYKIMLRKAFEPFQSELTEILENLESYTLIKMERKLHSHFSYLTSLFGVHCLATKNWKKDCNWMSSIRILSVLHNAVMEATTTKMSFLYLNFFLRCFQVYLDIIDSWISCVDLIDPNDEFIIAKCGRQMGKSDSGWSEFEIRPYKAEIEESGLKEVPFLELIASKMIHIGESLEVLKRLNRFVAVKGESREGSSYKLLLKAINEKIAALGKVAAREQQAKPQKKRSIFTMTAGLRLEMDYGPGDGFEIERFLAEEEGKEKGGSLVKGEPKKDEWSCREFMSAMVGNPFFKRAFDDVGMAQVLRKLEQARARAGSDGEETFAVVKEPDRDKIGVYPFQKIISEAFQTILGDRVSGACDLVKEIVLVECELPTHLTLLRSILLFNNSYLIQPFILAFFTQPSIWGNSYSLSLHLKECARGLYKDQASSLSVALVKNFSTRCENILDVIDILTVNYEVRWPLTLIFTAEVMRKYNEVFRLALKLKWAHWALSGLHFPNDRAGEGGSKATRHRVQLLRFWFLSSLGRISNYFMAQMIPPDLDLSSCRDLKDIIQAHKKFIDDVHYHCLLGGKSPEGRKLILDTLIPLCMDLWLEADRRRDSKLFALEQTFGGCRLQLSRLMSSLEK